MASDKEVRLVELFSNNDVREIEIDPNPEWNKGKTLFKSAKDIVCLKLSPSLKFVAIAIDINNQVLVYERQLDGKYKFKLRFKIPEYLDKIQHIFFNENQSYGQVYQIIVQGAEYVKFIRFDEMLQNKTL